MRRRKRAYKTETHLKVSYGYIDDEGNSVSHRVGGPSYMFKGGNDHGSLLWQVHDEYYDYTRTYCEACKFSKEKTLLWVIKYGDLLPEHIDQL